jgi:hypothetical protein
MLIIGTPLLVVGRDGTTTASGIEVYTLHSLLPEQRSIEGLAASAWLTRRRDCAPRSRPEPSRSR